MPDHHSAADSRATTTRTGTFFTEQRATRSATSLRRLITGALLTCLLAVVCVAPAAAKPPPAPNGQILFGNPDGAITTVNPDGSHPNGLIRADCGRWSPNGNIISTCGGPDPGGSTLLLDPLTGTVLTELFPPDPTLFLACYVWSPDGTRLACEHFQTPADPSHTGLYTISASTGGDIRPVNSLPGLQFCLGDYSPDATRIVVEATDLTRPPRTNTALFVANVDGSGLRQITSWEFPNSGDCTGSWSPNGDWILFDNTEAASSSYVRTDPVCARSRWLASAAVRSSSSPPGRLMEPSSYLPCSPHSGRQLLVRRRRPTSRRGSIPPTRTAATSTQ
jgi:hypothetical protein